jgi:hypothetical protein
MMIAKKPKLKRKKSTADRRSQRDSPDNILVRQDSTPKIDLEALLTGVAGRVSDLGEIVTYSPRELEKPQQNPKLFKKFSFGRMSSKKLKKQASQSGAFEIVPYKVNTPVNNIPISKRRGGVFIPTEPLEGERQSHMKKPKMVELEKSRSQTETNEPQQQLILEILGVEPSKEKPKDPESRLNPSKARIAIFKSK